MGNELSRRAFLRGAAASGAVEMLAASPPAQAGSDAAPPLKFLGPAAVDISMVVNGRTMTMHLPPAATLAQALRGLPGLTGTKIACNRGSCSACTVWLDGAPVCACMTLAIEVGARRVTTIEGLAGAEALHPVQAAFIEHDATQCGFCTPGMVMSCAALLSRVRQPSEDDVKDAIAGHLCRCGTYPHVVQATLAAATGKKEA